MSKIRCDINYNLVQFTGQKKHRKNDQELKFTFQNFSLQITSNVNTTLKYIMAPKKITFRPEKS